MPTSVAFYSEAFGAAELIRHRLPDGRVRSDNQYLPMEYFIGKQWFTRFDVVNAGIHTETTLACRIVRRESITVPAGTFNAFRVEGAGHSRGGPQGTASLHIVVWMDPERVRRPIANEETLQSTTRLLRAARFELVSFKQG